MYDRTEIKSAQETWQQAFRRETRTQVILMLAFIVGGCGAVLVELLGLL